MVSVHYYKMKTKNFVCTNWMDAHPKLNLERNIVFLLFSFVESENVMFVF